MTLQTTREPKMHNSLVTRKNNHIPAMKYLAKAFVAAIADVLNSMRGFKFPAYFCERDRVQVLLFGIEPDITRLLKRKLIPGMTVLDVGGNVGIISRICAKAVGKSGRVWTFEPDPYTRGFLENNVRRCVNVTVSPIALSDENTTAKLHIHPSSGTSNSLLSFDESNHAIDVECMTLDSFLERNPTVHPDCIKIDVEGAEPKVLEGMKNTINKYPKLFVIIEFCPKNLANGGYTPDDFFSQLEALGLSSEIILNDGRSEPVETVGELLKRLGGSIYCNVYCCRRTGSLCNRF